MGTQHKRATLYFDAELHRVKSAKAGRSVSELINDAVRSSLAEDAEDAAAFEEREDEPDLSFSEVVEDLRRRGKL